MRAGGDYWMIWKDKFFELLEEDTRLAWDYVTALRGCDIPSLNNSIDIKLFYTAPLRGELCNALNQYDTLERCKVLKTETDLINLINDLKRGVDKASPHYIFHASRGYGAIEQSKISKAISKTRKRKDKDKRMWEVIWRVNNYVRKGV